MWSVSKEECTSHWSRAGRRLAGKTADPGGEIHSTRSFRSMQSSLIAASMVIISIGVMEGRIDLCVHSYDEWPLDHSVDSLIFQWFRDQSVSMPVKDPVERPKLNQANTSREALLSETQEKWISIHWCTPSAKVSAIVSLSWPGSWFEVVAIQLFCGSCGEIPHACTNGQWWTHRYAAQIAGLMPSVWIRNCTQTGHDRPESHSGILCSNKSDVVGID